MIAPGSVRESPHRLALVTGASRGLGEVVATFLAGEGYDLLTTAREAAPLNVSAQQLRRFGSRIVPVAGDVGDPDHRRRLIETSSELGPLHVLVNNASELGPSPLPPLASLPLHDFRRVIDVNLMAPLALIQQTLPTMLNRGGLIVNISSDAAQAGYPGWGGYGASKAALDLVSLTLAHELKGSRVGVVSVDPGDMRTTMHQAAYPGENISDRPLPTVTIPFWAWLFGQDPLQVSGTRYRAQSDRWEIAQ